MQASIRRTRNPTPGHTAKRRTRPYTAQRRQPLSPQSAAQLSQAFPSFRPGQAPGALRFAASYAILVRIVSKPRSVTWGYLRQAGLESAGLLGLGLVLGLVLGVVRGIPEPSAQAQADGMCTAPVPQSESVSWISQPEARPLIEDPNVAFVDARQGLDYEAGHIAGALHAPAYVGSVDPELVRLLRTARSVVVYGDRELECKRSRSLAKALSRQGLADVRVLEQGFPGWMEQNGPAEAGPCNLCPTPSVSQTESRP